MIRPVIPGKRLSGYKKLLQGTLLYRVPLHFISVANLAILC